MVEVSSTINSEMEKIMPPSSFNWVEARRMCTPKLQFGLLAEEVMKNVKCINKLESRNGAWTFELKPNEKIIIARYVEEFQDSSIVFRLSKEAIVVTRSDGHGNHAPLFEAIPRLLDDTSYKLEIDDVPVEIWQVSRRALEGLFFS